MIYALAFLFVTTSSAHAELSWDEATKACAVKARWGYYKPMIWGEPSSDHWTAKDLSGQFKTKEACEADRRTYEKREWGKPCPPEFAKVKNCTKGPPKECQRRIVGGGITGIMYIAKVKISAVSEGEVPFRTLDSCKSSITAGGTFKVVSGKNIFETEVKASPLIESDESHFVGDCTKVLEPACERDQYWND